jgi:hypothetical protein
VVQVAAVVAVVHNPAAQRHHLVRAIPAAHHKQVEVSQPVAAAVKPYQAKTVAVHSQGRAVAALAPFHLGDLQLAQAKIFQALIGTLAAVVVLVITALYCMVLVVMAEVQQAAAHL